ncbi:DUF2946 family protein [uncultured Pseudacidovorax sp.]|uniref:DUF2946 family protein n=1 Tax=uncultured Pseudacidovorax sp. TaxID=679313 RepID=UPI0025D568BE|nr:DUF2946 family protein [uncultured Pseudacidovorax sp.]
MHARRRPSPKMPSAGRVARWLLLAHCLLLLLPMWPALNEVQAQGARLPADAFMVCTAQGMQALPAAQGAAVVARTGTEGDADPAGETSDAVPTSLGCALCHARVLMPLPAWTPGLPLRAISSPPPVPQRPLVLVADAPWRPLQARAPPPALAG